MPDYPHLQLSDSPEGVRTITLDRADKLNADQLRDIACKSNAVVAGLGVPYKWITSYVAGDKIYCVHQAEDIEVIREHSRRGRFPANLVAEVVSTFGSEGVRDLPR